MRSRFCLALSLACISAEVAAQPATPERVVSGDGIVSISVNGAPGRIRIDPAAPALPILTSPFALGLWRRSRHE